MTGFASRACSNRDLPVIGSRLDTDFYKLLMAQSVIRHRPAVEVTFSIVNRTTSVRLAEEVDEDKLRAEFDRARTLALTPTESAYLSGLEIESLHRHFAGRVKVAFGWGTLLTNDFRGLCAADALAPFSLVCKAVSADGRPTVKLSDNPAKALGPSGEVARYRRVFAVGAQETRAVEV